MSLTKNKYLAPIITRVYYQFIYNIVSVNPGSTDNHKTVLFQAGQNWLEIYKVPKDVNFDEPIKRTDAGNLYEQKLQLSFPGDDESNLADFNNLEHRPLIVKFEYDNSKSKLIGEVNNPVTASISYSTSRGGSVITFECDSRNRAFWI